jgi:hypothetical protein
MLSSTSLIFKSTPAYVLLAAQRVLKTVHVFVLLCNVVYAVLCAQQVIEQLRCAGVIEAIRISRAAYPNRMLHEDCVRYSDTNTADSASYLLLLSVLLLVPLHTCSY